MLPIAELPVFSVILANMTSQSIHIPLTINLSKTEIIETPALINSGAGGIFIHTHYAKQLGLKWIPLDKSITTRNVDRTPNKRRLMTYYVLININVGEKKLLIKAYIIGLGKESLILGFPWLQKYNPIIDWKTGKIQFQNERYKDVIRKVVNITQEWWSKNPAINAFQLQKQLTPIRTLQRATIEEIPDEELTKNSEVLTFRIEVKEDDMVAETLQEGETLLAYYPGLPIVGVFENPHLNDFLHPNLGIMR